MMKVNLLKWCVLVVVVLAGRQTLVFAEDGAPSDSALKQMGLSGLVIMTDDEAMDVRGEGFGSGGSSASAWGSSFATIETPFGSAESENGYSAHGKHEADGSNLSFAGVEITTSGGDHGHKPPKDGGMGNDRPSKGDSGYGGKGGNKGGKDYGSKGGDKGSKGSYGGSGGKGSKGSGGDKGGYGGGGDKGHGSKGNGGYGGGKGGNKGGGSKSASIVVFAGGSSRAHSK